MYVPAAFAVKDQEKVRGLVERHPLGVLVTAGEGGLCANHVPFLLRERDGGWRLEAHVARANPVWKEHGGRALVVFRGAEAYVSPGWYPSKGETGRVVPTWNYAAVHMSGALRAVEDEGWLRELVTELAARHEDYVTGMLKAIVGIEIAVERVEAKWKASQNREEADARGAARGLRASGREEMADMIEEFLS
jgi:transcriptional regulator